MVNNRVEIRPATRHDIKYFFGDKMRDCCRAWSAFYDGELVAIGGVAITRHLMLVFMKMNLKSKVPNITIWRASIKIWDKIKSIGYPILYAVADNDMLTAPNFLKRIGFEQISYDEEKRVFRWQIH